MPEFHKDQLPEDGLHVAIRWRVLDQAARDALVLTPDEVGGLLFQDDVSSLFVLLNAAPVTWLQVPDGESTLAAIIAVNARVDECVVGPSVANDNAVVRYDGTTGKLVQDSLATLSDSGFLTVENLHVANDISIVGTVDGVDISNLAMALASVALPDYVTLSSTPTLANERTLAQGPGILITDGGPGGAVTIESTVTAGAPVGASYLTLGANATLTSERVLTPGPGVSFTDGGAGGALTINSVHVPVSISGPLYTLALSDAGKMLLTGGGMTTITVPTAAAVPFPSGTVIVIGQNETSTPTIVGDAGVTVRFPTGRSSTLGGLYSVIVLKKISSADFWSATGDLAEVASYLTLGTALNLANERVLAVGDGMSSVDGGAGGAFTLALRTVASSSALAAYTLALTDAWDQILFSGSGAVNVTIPDNATVAFATGTEIHVTQAGTGAVCFDLPAGVTLNSGAGTQFSGPATGVSPIAGRFGTVRLLKTATNNWYASGDLAPTVFAAGSFTVTSQIAGFIVNTVGTSTVTLNAQATTPFPIGGSIRVIKGFATSTVTFVAGAGATVNVPAGLAATISDQFCEALVTKTAADTWLVTGGLDGAPPLALNNQTGTAYTLVLADAPKCVTMNNAAANTLTIPANASVAFPIGTVITVMQLGTGQTTIAITTDTLLNPGLTAKLRARYSVASLTKITATSWVLSGDLAAS